MSNYRRARIPGGIYFFTLVAYRRRPLFASDQARYCLRQSIAEVRERSPFEMDAICLLPDHLHAIWKLPEGDGAYSQRWNEIKGLFSKNLRTLVGGSGFFTRSREQKGEADFWQRRFWEHLIRNETDYRRHLDYLHFNPVKHGLVERVLDWPWSSFHRYVRTGLYSADWGGSIPAKMNLSTVGE